MPIPIISASGAQYPLIVNSDGSINTTQIGGATGSKSYIIDTSPKSPDRNNEYYSFIYLTSGTATGVTGSKIGSIVQFIGAGSYVQVLTYSNNLITNVGSWI